MKIVTLLFAIASFIWPANAHATSITWSLDLEFEDGGTAVGSFVWDTTIHAATSWNIAVSGGVFGFPMNPVFAPAIVYDDTLVGHSTSAFVALNNYGFIQFHTAIVDHFPGPARPRLLRLGLGFEGLGVLNTPVAALSLLEDDVNTIPISSAPFIECGNCSPVRRGVDEAVITSVTPVPIPASLALLPIGFAAIATLKFRRRRSV